MSFERQDVFLSVPPARIAALPRLPDVALPMGSRSVGNGLG
jgi:hypothetical protein